MDGNLLKGLINRSPMAADASTKLPAKNIDSDAIRSGAAKTPKTLGPRSA